MNLLKIPARWLGRLVGRLGCDKRWMVVMCPGYDPQPQLVRHYFGEPSWGWEMFDMFGPFATEQEARDFISSANT
jgi:hypothetical protein